MQDAAAGFDSGLVAFLDAGYYLVTDTVLIPPNVRITGEALSAVIMGAGPAFSDITAPYPVVQVGLPGDTGYIEWSDTIVSTQGATAGAVLIEYNLETPFPSMYLHGTAGSPPSGMWDVHVRVGGFAGSDLQLAQCPTTPTEVDVVNPSCIAAYMSMYITPSASYLYIENSWLWVAEYVIPPPPPRAGVFSNYLPPFRAESNILFFLSSSSHDIEDLDNTQISIFAGRGMHVASTKGRIWLVGTAVEHHTLYQYQLVNTRDIWMGQIQTETPYYQPNPPAPYPFVERNNGLYDPDFTFDCPASAGTFGGSNGTALPGNPPCEMAWGLIILGSVNVNVFGAGLYSFFNNFNTSCSDQGGGEKCQARIFQIGETPAEPGHSPALWLAPATQAVEVYNLNTVGTVVMISRQSVDVALYEPNVAGFTDTVALFSY